MPDSEGPPPGEPWRAHIEDLPMKFGMSSCPAMLPLVGRFDPKKAAVPIWQIFEGITIDDGHKGPLAFWGWQPLGALAQHLERAATMRPAYEYLDLGTPTQPSAPASRPRRPAPHRTPLG